MKERNKKIQLSLVFIGFLLIILTYYFYPKIIEIKNKKLISEKKEIIKIDEEVTNMFENVEYKGLYNINEPFTVKSEKAGTSYKLSENQVMAILELRLQKLTAFGIEEIETEIKKLTKVRLNDRASSSWNELRMLKKEKLFLKDRINFIR